MKHSCVWIDPIDATLSYTQGHLHEVTTLIGLSYKGEARLGVIGLPYNNKVPAEFSPQVMFGSASHPKVYQMDLAKNLKTYTQRSIPTNFTITTSRVDTQ